MLINTYLDTEDFVHLYYPEDETPPANQGCGANARMHNKLPPRAPSPDFDRLSSTSSNMNERERARAPPPPEPPPHRIRAADLYPRTRTHYDEPGLDVGFNTICGEFVQWVGRTADGGTLAMSNYRVHVQPRRRSDRGLSVPVRLVDSVEIRDLVHLLILCKDGKTVKCTFASSEICVEWWRRISTGIAPLGSLQDTFAACYAAWAKEQPPVTIHRDLLRRSALPQKPWFGQELERLGFTSKGSWRVSTVNSEYKLCPSYPPLLVVPATIGDEDLDSVARFRAMRRIPTVVWRHRGNGAVIARSSQPEVGWLGWRSNEDERLLAAIRAASVLDNSTQSTTNKQNKLLIVDARSYASAVTNRARGGGCECAQYYPDADIQFMCLPNIHHVRRAFHQIRQLAHEDPDQPNWLSALERTLWLQYVSGVGRAASLVVGAVEAGRPVLVHCSDGWDRTPQIVAAAQLMLDPYYRTQEGFRVLITREWLEFGHKFGDRCGHQFGPEEPNERSPVFLQWLDLVHQLMLQYPTRFEFNHAYLLKLVTHVHSCMFGTFLCNSGRERQDNRTHDVAQLWPLLEDPAYINHLYAPTQHDQVLWAEFSVRSLSVWSEAYCVAGRTDPPHPRDPSPHRLTHYNGHGVMSKTRSCDNLLAEDRPPAQRRSSDPNIAGDVMKLSSLVSGSGSVTSLGRKGAVLSDTVLDGLIVSDQVDGAEEPVVRVQLESGTLASNSSSLERELLPPHPLSLNTHNHQLHNDHTEPHSNGRVRAVSITWRSVSESSHSGEGAEGGEGADLLTHPLHALDTTDTMDTLDPLDALVQEIQNNGSESESSEVTNGNACDVMTSTLTNHNDISHTPNGGSGLTNGDSIHLIDRKMMEVDLGTSSSVSSESECESGGNPRAVSQSTLCPNSPRRRIFRPRHTQSMNGGGGGGECGRCGCGSTRDAADGLPPHHDPLHNRLQQIIRQHQEVVQELSRELREARSALHRVTPPSAPPLTPRSPTAQSGCGSSGGGGGSNSGSGSEVEVGEDARAVVWLPDSAATRCQHCRNHFWLARRRHHCRKCGGIFCGSCSEMSSVGEWNSVRVCRRCRTMR